MQTAPPKKQVPNTSANLEKVSAKPRSRPASPASSATTLDKSQPQSSRAKNKQRKPSTSDRIPKGSEDQIKQYNRYECLDEDMEADDSPADTNKQGRIIKINNKR